MEFWFIWHLQTHKNRKRNSSSSVHLPHSASCPLPLPLLPSFTSSDPVGPSPLSSSSDASAPRFNVRRLVSLLSSHIPKRTGQKEERTGSIDALDGRRGLDIIYLYLHLLLLRYRKRMRSRDGANRNVSREPSHIETSYSRVSWRRRRKRC